MSKKSTIPTPQKPDAKSLKLQTTSHRFLATSSAALAIKLIEENRLKGLVIEIPSIGLTINGSAKSFKFGRLSE